MYVRVASSPWSCGFWTGGFPVTTASNSFPQVGYQSSNIETIPPWYRGLVFTRNVSARGLFRYRPSRVTEDRFFPLARSSRPSDGTAINRMSGPRGSAPTSRANSSAVAVRPASRLNTSNRFATCSTLECQYAELIRATVIGSSALEADRPSRVTEDRCFPSSATEDRCFPRGRTVFAPPRARPALPFAAFTIRLPMCVSDARRLPDHRLGRRCVFGLHRRDLHRHAGLHAEFLVLDALLILLPARGAHLDHVLAVAQIPERHRLALAALVKGAIDVDMKMIALRPFHKARFKRHVRGVEHGAVLRAHDRQR